MLRFYTVSSAATLYQVIKQFLVDYHVVNNTKRALIILLALKKPKPLYIQNTNCQIAAFPVIYCERRVLGAGIWEDMPEGELKVVPKLNDWPRSEASRTILQPGELSCNIPGSQKEVYSFRNLFPPSIKNTPF